ncbi:AI-2E family transporter [Patescibacteria group bacterium]
MAEIKPGINPGTDRKVISISTGTIIKFLLVILALFAIYLVRDVVLIVFVALVVAATIDPAVDWMERRKIPRAISVLLILAAILAVFFAILFFLIPPIVEQLVSLGNSLPEFFDRFQPALQSLSEAAAQGSDLASGLQSIFSSLGDAVASVSSDLFGRLGSFLGGILSFLVGIVITFYLTSTEQGIKRFVKSIVPSKYQDYISKLVSDIQLNLGRWLRGQVIMGLIVGVLVYIALTILGVEYALVLAVLAAVLELVPYVGPILSAVPAIFLALTTQSPLIALLVVVAYIVIQQIENHILYPKIMQKVLGINPVVIIIALLIGAKLGGFPGLLIAVPVTIVISVFLKGLLKDEKSFPGGEFSWRNLPAFFRRRHSEKQNLDK